MSMFNIYGRYSRCCDSTSAQVRTAQWSEAVTDTLNNCPIMDFGHRPRHLYQ